VAPYLRWVYKAEFDAHPIHARHMRTRLELHLHDPGEGATQPGEPSASTMEETGHARQHSRAWSTYVQRGHVRSIDEESGSGDARDDEGEGWAHPLCHEETRSGGGWVVGNNHPTAVVLEAVGVERGLGEGGTRARLAPPPRTPLPS
jgi:hypothetical protein